MSRSDSNAARNTSRPIRPKPLMPSLAVVMILLVSYKVGKIMQNDMSYCHYRNTLYCIDLENSLPMFWVRFPFPKTTRGVKCHSLYFLPMFLGCHSSSVPFPQNESRVKYTSGHSLTCASAIFFRPLFSLAVFLIFDKKTKKTDSPAVRPDDLIVKNQQNPQGKNAMPPRLDI